MILAPNGTPARRALNGHSRTRDHQPQSWFDVYEAADRADFRGWFYFPTLTPREQQTSMTRRQLAERIDFLYKNVGAVTMLIDGLALEEVGTGLWPKWTSASEPFNKAITDRFHYAVHDPRIFSADGRSDYYTAQFNIRRMIRLYGDCFGQLLRPPPGSVHPQLHLLGGYRIDNVGDEGENSGWSDGILENKMGRPVKYRVLTSEHAGNKVDVEAADILHFHDPFLPEQRRGVSCLASVAKRLYRREDIYKALANGTLARERMGFAITTKEEGGGPILMPGGTGEEIENADGTKYSLQKFFGRTAGDELQVPTLPPGTDVHLLESNRPGTPQMEFLDSILREGAWATKYAPEYIFFLAGMGQGTVARLVMQRVRSIVHSTRQFQLIPQFTNRWTVFHAWQMISAGLFDNVEGGIPEDWWKHKTMADADKSVDIAREGRLYDDRVATNKMSIESYHALSGEDASDVEDENLAVYSRRLTKLGALNEAHRTNLQYFDIWPRSINNQVPTITAPEGPEL